MPSIRSRDIACLEGPDIRGLVHFLKLPDVINHAFNVHPEQYSEPALPDRTAVRFTDSPASARTSLAPANSFGKIVVIEDARHKIRQNAGLPLGIDLVGSR
ncbi:MAG: hypothetical protein WCF22_15970 [Candidatus Sulfotelmatobacter sp.]